MLLRSYSQTLLWKFKIEHISRSTVWDVIKFGFVICPRVGLPSYIYQRCQPFIFKLKNCFFKKQKEGWNKSPCLIFCMIFEDDVAWFAWCFSHYILLAKNFIVLFSFLIEILGKICTAIICCPVSDVKSFWLTLTFLARCFSL